MENKKRLLVGGISGAIGGVLGAVSGSHSLLVVSCVAAISAIIIAWGINGMFK